MICNVIKFTENEIQEALNLIFVTLKFIYCYLFEIVISNILIKPDKFKDNKETN